MAQQGRHWCSKEDSRMRKLVLVLAALGATGVVVARLLDQWRRTWGISPVEAVKSLPGDELVPNAATSETRGITIEAPASVVWPWLVQMGYGRGGWYSYDQIDMGTPSATTILPELQQLAVGDLLPTHPGGGFEVKVLDPERALVVYTDTAMVQRQLEEARASGAEAPTLNVQATGAAMTAAQPGEFAASWAFVLEPLDGDRSRLVERVRAWFGVGEQPWMRYTLPLMGFGVFVMVRRQLLGIRSRVERATGRSPAAEEGAPA
jgi:hypothetical protein